MRQISKILILSLVITSCSKEVPLTEIDFGNDELIYKIAIDGFISNEYERCKVKVTKPLSITSKREEEIIEDAELILKHKNDIFYFMYDTTGIYYSIDSIAAVAGETYKLEVRYNGNTYTAEETMPGKPNDEFYIPFFYVPSYDDNENPRPYDPNSVSLHIHVHNFGYQKTNIWGYELSRFHNNSFPDLDVYQYIAIPIYTHKGSIPQGIFPPTTIGTGAYGAASDSIEILKAEISERYNRHLLDKFNETDWQGGMFSTIPGNVTTNLSEGAIGYFYALNIKKKRFVIGDFDGMQLKKIHNR